MMWRHYHQIVLDDKNEMMEERSLEHLMSGSKLDNNVSQLEYVCKQLGVRGLFTTTCMQKWLVRESNILGHTTKVYTGEWLKESKGQVQF